MPSFLHRSDQGIDFGHISVIELLHSSFDACWPWLPQWTWMCSLLWWGETWWWRSSQTCFSWGTLLRVFGLALPLGSQKVGDVAHLVAVDTFQQCLLGLQSLHFGVFVCLFVCFLRFIWKSNREGRKSFIQCLGWGRLKPRTSNSLQDFHYSAMGPSTLATFDCFPRNVSRGLVGRKGNQDSKWHSNTGCQAFT